MAKNKKWILAAVAVLAVVLCCWAAWSKWASTTRIGLVNFQNYQTASLVKSNEDNFIEYEEIPLDRLDRLGRYDLVLGFGMGLKITEEQRAQILAAADEGTPIYIYAATNPENDICSLDSLTEAGLSAYIGNGNKRNYRNMARYVRQHIDAKRLFVTPAEEAVESASDVLYHLDEDLSFKTVADYEKYLREQGIYREKAPKIAIVGGLNDPFSGNRANIDSLIVSLQNAGMNVYPVSSYRQRLTFLRIDATQCTLIAAPADVMDLFGERTPFFRKIGHGGAPVALMRTADDQPQLCHPGQQRCHRRFIQHTSLGDLPGHRPIMLKQIQQDLRLSRHQLQLRRLRNDGAVAEVKAPQQLKMQFFFQHPVPPFCLNSN